MSLIYALKLICDLSFYLTFGAFICAMITGNNLMAAVPFLFGCAALSALLANKGNLRYLPLILLVPAVFAVRGSFLNYLFLAPACIYTGYYVSTLPIDTTRMEYAEIFGLFLKIAAPVVIFFTLVDKEVLENVGIPYGIVFILCSIILMRMIRHDSEVLSQTRFKIMNMLSVASVFILGALTGSKQFLGFVGSLLKRLYFSIIAPVITFLLQGLLFILSPIFNLFDFDTRVKFYDQEINTSSAWDDLRNEVANESGLGLQLFKLAVFAALLGVGIYLLYCLFKKFTQQYEERSSVSNDRRVFLDKGQNAKRKEKANGQMRQLYRKFLMLCKERGIPFFPATTSEDVARNSGNLFGGKEDAEYMRNVYIENRYGEREVTKEQIKECKNIYTKFKKSKLV